MTFEPAAEGCNTQQHSEYRPPPPDGNLYFDMATLVASGHVPPAPIKEQVADQLPKRFKEMKFGIQ